MEKRLKEASTRVSTPFADYAFVEDASGGHPAAVSGEPVVDCPIEEDGERGGAQPLEEESGKVNSPFSNFKVVGKVGA
ncbi:hypothetical protein FA13DRAFT_1734537 [Coprinellus micaceus]|uniref:Uncharacterized protein n=1 Tax=Coprinellus micaceus TaxID=71717 RepID=A0A4Y7T856_COPMI|nr:hypothetical protein FA13DRAFT_1734537 [Coprinellus micaceus]